MPSHYINTDLKLESSSDLEGLIRALCERGMFCLHVKQDSSNFRATLETDIDLDNPADTIAAMLKSIEGLASPDRLLWNQCAVREFDIGYESGVEPWVI